MNGASALSLFGALTIAAVWALSVRRRHLTTPFDLICRIHPNQLARLEAFLSQEQDRLDSDREFWHLSGGYKGLMRRRQNAHCLIQLCQIITSRADVDPIHVRELTRKAMLITFMLGCSIVESGIRFFVPDIPHMCARFATIIYSEIEESSRALFGNHPEVDPSLSTQLLQLLKV